MKIHEHIKKVLKARPYWGCARVAEHIGKSIRTTSVIASRHNIQFASRRDVEDVADALVLENNRLKKELRAASTE